MCGQFVTIYGAKWHSIKSENRKICFKKIAILNLIGFEFFKPWYHLVVNDVKVM